MRKRIKTITGVVLMCAITVCITCLSVLLIKPSMSMSVMAADGISTNGNIVLGDGEETGIYVDDFHYLQQEIIDLFNEIDTQDDTEDEDVSEEPEQDNE